VVQERFTSAAEVLEQLQQLPRRVQLPPNSKPLRPPSAPLQPAPIVPVVRPLPVPQARPTLEVVLGQIFLIAAVMGLWVMAAVVKLGAPVGLSLLFGLLLGGWVWFWGRTWLQIPWLAGLWVMNFILLAWFVPGAWLRLGVGSLILALVILGIVTLTQWLRQALR